MERTLTSAATEKLDRRAALPVDAGRTIAIKRDVHEFIVDAPGAELARAFREVVTAADSTFGLIRVKRPGGRMGADFTIGERFQGCFSLERALRAVVTRHAPSATPLLNELLASPAVTRAITWVEDQMLSDYAEIVALEEPAPGRPGWRLHYRYLDGTPIAGSSVFTIEELGPGRSRVRQIFEYQEVNAVALLTFQRFGLKYHDQVVAMEIQRAAERCGARVVSSTIPVAYVGLAS
jgi:hypothetical protein